MEFEYTAIIYIIEEDLEDMVNRVKRGENFDDFYYDIMASYDDYAYYNCDLIKDKVQAEIKRRIG